MWEFQFPRLLLLEFLELKEKSTHLLSVDNWFEATKAPIPTQRQDLMTDVNKKRCLTWRIRNYIFFHEIGRQYGNHAEN